MNTWLMNPRVELVNDSREPGLADSAILLYWMVVLNTEEESDLTPKDEAELMRCLIPTDCWCGSVLAVWRDGSKVYSRKLPSRQS